LIEYRALLFYNRDLLTEYGALLIEYRALLLEEYRALLICAITRDPYSHGIGLFSLNLDIY